MDSCPDMENLMALKTSNQAIEVTTLKASNAKNPISLKIWPNYFKVLHLFNLDNVRAFLIYFTRISGRQAAPYSSCEVPGDVPRHMFRGMYKDKFRGMCLDMFRGMSVDRQNHRVTESHLGYLKLDEMLNQGWLINPPVNLLPKNHARLVSKII